MIAMVHAAIDALSERNHLGSARACLRIRQYNPLSHKRRS
jgi:hypothetical protein